ncbi:hypothetical protein Nepgr_007689 [Nepenthes gracilis]|uniref:Uncharacterized protein n=1 Tax=Nepenthes gracilis TaxID=150966 RepID=A0AAD3XIK2_NEPGR|nr:hypothetical protein Nepgr_007689 [Nepenthes gracilis]
MSAIGLLPTALQGIDIKEMLYWPSDGVESKDMAVLPYKDSLLLFSRYSAADLQQLEAICRCVFERFSEEHKSRCTGIFYNEDGSIIPLTFNIRAEWEARFNSFAGKETLRYITWALKRIPMGQQLLAFEDEKDITLIELVRILDPPREEVQDAILPCMNASICIIIVTGDNKTTAKSLCRKIGAFDHLDEFVGYSYTASEFVEPPALQKIVALQRLALFTRVKTLSSSFCLNKATREIQLELCCSQFSYSFLR